MSVLQQFWLTLLEVLYLPIYSFIGYDSFVTFVCLVLFVALQLWCFWHLFFKPFIYVLKFFVTFINKNLFFSEVEVDEKHN